MSETTTEEARVLAELHRRYGGASEPLPTLLRSLSSAIEARAQAATALYEALRAQVSAVTKCWCPPMKGDQHSYVYPDHLEFCESARKAIAEYEKAVKG